MFENKNNMNNPLADVVIKTDNEVKLIDGNHRAEAVKLLAPKKRGRPAKVEKEIFIEMWNKSANLDEVSSLLNISKSSCSVRASNLRKQGNELRQFTRGRKRRAMEETSI